VIEAVLAYYSRYPAAGYGTYGGEVHATQPNGDKFFARLTRSASS